MSARVAPLVVRAGAVPRGVCETSDGEVVGGKKFPIGVADDPSFDDKRVGIEDGVDSRPV